MTSFNWGSYYATIRMKAHLKIFFKSIICSYLFVGNLLMAHPRAENSLITDFDCNTSYPDVMSSLPFPLSEFGSLMCFGNGQSIMAKPTWSWRYSGSFFDTPRIPASAHDDMAAVPPPYYFRVIFSTTHAQEIKADRKTQYLDRLMSEVVTFRPQAPISQLYAIDLTNNHHVVIRVFVALETKINGWLLVCNPECQPEYVILFKKRESHQ